MGIYWGKRACRQPVVSALVGLTGRLYVPDR